MAMRRSRAGVRLPRITGLPSVTGPRPRGWSRGRRPARWRQRWLGLSRARDESAAATAEEQRFDPAFDEGGDVARTVSGVAHIAAATAEGAATTRQAASDLTRLAGSLTTIVAEFRH